MNVCGKTVPYFNQKIWTFGCFAVRLPSLSKGEMDLGCGITFDIFTHVLHGSFFFAILLIFDYIKVLTRREKKYIMKVLKMDIMLYLQKEIRTVIIV